jgi:hypothetical protein
MSVFSRRHRKNGVFDATVTKPCHRVLRGLQRTAALAGLPGPDEMFTAPTVHQDDSGVAPSRALADALTTADSVGIMLAPDTTTDRVYVNGAGTTIVASDDGFRLVWTKS